MVVRNDKVPKYILIRKYKCETHFRSIGCVVVLWYYVISVDTFFVNVKG